MGKKVERVEAGAEREQVWSGRIEGWRRSGQTQAKYCADHELSVWVMRKWIVKLGASGLTAGRRPALLPIPLHRADKALLEAQVKMPEAALEIALPNGTRIRASGRSASELTRSIARVLRC